MSGIINIEYGDFSFRKCIFDVAQNINVSPHVIQLKTKNRANKKQGMK